MAVGLVRQLKKLFICAIVFVLAFAVIYDLLGGTA